MDSKKIESLLNKYWDGNSTPEEEEWLGQLVRGNKEIELGDEDRGYFEMLNKYRTQYLPDSFELAVLNRIKENQRRGKMRRFFSIAAVGLIFLTGGFILVQESVTDQNRVAELQEAREAFELTKQALFVLSSELNRGASFTQELEQFDETFEKLKSQDAHDN